MTQIRCQPNLSPILLDNRARVSFFIPKSRKLQLRDTRILGNILVQDPPRIAAAPSDEGWRAVPAPAAVDVDVRISGSGAINPG